MLRDGPSYVMTLYIAGASRRSLRAVDNVRAFCEQELAGDYALDVVDLYRSPDEARAAQIVAAPTLVRHKPDPPRRVIGDMSNLERLRQAIKVE